MNIWVYADESGVLDKQNQEFFVYGGVIFLDNDSRKRKIHTFLNVERDIRRQRNIRMRELKACKISKKDKYRLFKVLNKCIKFAVVIEQKNVHDNIFDHKKSKQRYLDYSFKIGLKRAFQKLIENKCINPEDVQEINVFVDEHTTATNGIYELREALEEEFKIGTSNFSYNKFYPPIFRKMKKLNLKFCNSENEPMIRGSDIIANRIYSAIRDGELKEIQKKVYITFLP